MTYLDKIFEISEPYLQKTLCPADQKALVRSTKKLRDLPQSEMIKKFGVIFRDIVKKRHQAGYEHDPDFDRAITKKNGKVKVVWGDCLDALRAMKSESVQLMTTSPPYYNARDYSHWANLDAYLADMKAIIQESWRVLDNHRAWVFNVGDITGNDHRDTQSSWGARRIPLGAYFIQIFEDCGFKFIDDFIWDKGEVESQRHKNGDTPSPMYQYPMNCYEHIMVFYKHRADETRLPCPVCGCLKVNGNAYSGVGIRSWECKNLECFERSAADRGKRFSERSIMMDELKVNHIDAEFVKKWRRDIIKINPTIKINSKGENTLGHTAPYPAAIPDPFAGSFTTAIEAARLGRIGVGIELNEKTFKKAILANIKKHGFEGEQIKCPRTTKSALRDFTERCA